MGEGSVRPPRLLPQVTVDGVAHWLQRFIFLILEGGKPQIKALADSGCSRGLIPGSQMVHPLLCPPGVEGTRELSGASFFKALVLFKRG